MSRLTGLLTPELRITMEAMLAKPAMPSLCSSDDEAPILNAGCEIGQCCSVLFASEAVTALVVARGASMRA